MNSNYTAGGAIAPVDRPNPLGKAASSVGVAWSAASGVVGALVTFGVLNVAQGEAVTAAGQAAEGTVTALGTVLAGVLPLIAGVVSAFRTTAAAKDHVTPVADPRNDAGQALTPDAVMAKVSEGGPVGPTSSGPGVVGDGETWS